MGGRILLTFLGLFALHFFLAAAETHAIHKPRYHALPSLKDQAVLINGWREERRAAIPQLLRKHEVDAWLISQREYAEDTVFWSLKWAKQFSARRRTTSIFFANAKDGEQAAYTWIDNTPRLWDELLTVLDRYDPQSIVVNINGNIAFSDGFHAGEFEEVMQQVGEYWLARFEARPQVAVEYVGTMPKAQLEWYRKLMETAWAMISEAFSARVITPGTTTTDDVEWWLRERIQSMNYTTWFHPSVTILAPNSTMGDSIDRPIAYGDLLHVDFGVTALGLNTDTQHLTYVLPPGATESDIPQGLVDGLRKANRLQDIVRENMKPGLSGNTVLSHCQAVMSKEGIEGKIYSHPIGDWGHSAGGLIGMTNLQDGVPVLGDLEVLENTYYSIELYAEHWVPEYNASMRFFLEEDVYWDGESKTWEWVYGRQDKFHLVDTREETERLIIMQ